MAVYLDRPDFAHTARNWNAESIPAGTEFVKIYNDDHVRAGHYSRDAFNPNPIEPDDPSTRGRFSGTLADDYSYMYVAEVTADASSGGTVRDETVAVWEMMDHRNVGVTSGSNLYVPMLSFPAGLAFTYVTLSRSINILNIRNQREFAPFLADWHGAINGTDYRVTREWARYIRSQDDLADGFRYTSYRLGPVANLSAIVLFSEKVSGPRGTLSASSVGPSVRLNSFEGRQKLAAALGPGISLI